MPNSSKLLLAALGLTVMAGCGEQAPDASEPATPPTPQAPATSETAVVEAAAEEQSADAAGGQPAASDEAPQPTEAEIEDFRERVSEALSGEELNGG